MSCEYCRESNDNTPIADVRAPGVSAYAVISEEGELAITSVTREINVSASPINYCPMCGRDLRGGGAMGSREVELGSVRVLDCADDSKEQAVKVLEEAAEVVEAWKHLDIWQRRNDHGQNESAIAAEKEWVADELADVITAACGLASGCGIDMAAAMERCEKRNRERGRL